MAREASLKIKIGSDSEIDVLTTYGFHLIAADDNILPSLSDVETVDYPEENGARIYPKVKQKAFDYKITLGCKGNEDGINATINKFWSSLFTSTTGLMEPREVTIVNNYNRVTLKGVTKQIATTKYHDGGDIGVTEFEWTIYVYSGEITPF